MADNNAFDSESVSLTVTLAGRPYPLRVMAKDEESIRRIVKELNDRVNSLQQSYNNKDKQDCLAMLLLIYAMDLFRVKEGVQTDPQLVRNLLKLEEQLQAAVPSHNKQPAQP